MKNKLLTCILVLLVFSLGYIVGQRNRNNCIHPAELKGCELSVKTLDEALRDETYKLEVEKEILRQIVQLCRDKIQEIKEDVEKFKETYKQK